MVASAAFEPARDEHGRLRCFELNFQIVRKKKSWYIYIPKNLLDWLLDFKTWLNWQFELVSSVPSYPAQAKNF
jgi:hypothetical protein